MSRPLHTIWSRRVVPPSGAGMHTTLAEIRPTELCSLLTWHKEEDDDMKDDGLVLAKKKALATL